MPTHHGNITKRKKLIQKIKKGWKLLKDPQIPINYKQLTHYNHKH